MHLNYETTKSFNRQLHQTNFFGDNKYLSRSSVKDNKRKCNSFKESQNPMNNCQNNNYHSLFFGEPLFQQQGQNYKQNSFTGNNSNKWPKTPQVRIPITINMNLFLSVILFL